MTEYSNENRGALFRNQKKSTEKHPEYNGSINVNGVDYWISGWLKESQQGTKYMSLSVNPKEQMEAQQPKPAPQQQKTPVSTEDIPF